MAEPAFGKAIHAVRGVGAAVEHVGQEHRIIEGLGFDAVALHQQVVVFQVLRDLEDGGILQQILQSRQRITQRNLIVG